MSVTVSQSRASSRGETCLRHRRLAAITRTRTDPLATQERATTTVNCLGGNKIGPREQHRVEGLTTRLVTDETIALIGATMNEMRITREVDCLTIETQPLLRRRLTATETATIALATATTTMLPGRQQP